MPILAISFLFMTNVPWIVRILVFIFSLIAIKGYIIFIKYMRKLLRIDTGQGGGPEEDQYDSHG